MPRLRYSLSDIYKAYPYKKKLKGILSNEGSQYFPKSEIVENHEFSITRQEFLEITNAIFKKRFKDLLEGNTIKIPLRSGTLELLKYKPKRPSIDFQTTKKLYGEYNKNNPTNKKVVYHKNYHTNGYKPLIKWDKRKAVFKNKQIFKFEFVRARDREISKFFKNQPYKINNLNSV